ncbi:MAG: tyrosine-protein phosphatase [Rhodobacteraceae bacterium]|nr:tyrosine-protein phosphatase [Paracoccaceae bacterium]
MSLDRRHIAMAGVHNIRDLGGYGTARGTQTAWRRFLRADSPHDLGEDGQARLQQEGLSTVIDLRTEAEIAQGPNPFRARAGVQYVHQPLFDSLAPAALAAAGAGDCPLVGFYRSALDDRHEALREIMVLIARADEGAVMFHCTAGKDRTGLVAALLLGLAEVGTDDIVADYALTEGLISGLVATFLEAAARDGRDVQAYARLLAAPEATMRQTLAHLAATYGSVPRYLDHIGVPRGDVSALTDRLHDTGSSPLSSKPVRALR